jgi:NAD(P)-dependent dehydrogenase (short-subunit alcohol dehydrogenase family)
VRLYDAFKARGLTSRFLNDALKLRVGVLSRAAAEELARRGAGAAVAARMVDAAGGFAYGLQWLGDFACRRPGQLDAACDAYADDVASIFQSWWTGLDAHQRQLVKRCLPGDVTVDGLDDRSRRRLRGLTERGLVAERAGRFVVDGEAWRGFVADAD